MSDKPALSPPPALIMWLAAALWAASWLVPIRELPWQAFHADLLCAAALMLLAVSLLRSEPGRVSVPLTALVVAALALVPGLQAASGLILFGGDAWMASLYLMGFAAAIFCGHALARSNLSAGMVLAWAVLVVGLISAVMALCQWLLLAPLHPWWRALAPFQRPSANVGQSNLLATLLVLALLSAVALHHATRLKLRLLLAAATVLVPGIVVTQSRTALVAMGVAVLWLWAVRHRAKLRSAPALWLVLLLATLVCVLARPWLVEVWELKPGRLTPTLQGGTRAVHWATLLQALQQAPWFGYGWNQVAVAQATAPALAFSGEFIEHAHNVLLDLLIWNGLPLGAAWVVALISWVWQRARQCQSPAPALLLAGVWVLLVHAMTEYPLDYFGYLMLLGLLVGAVDALAPSPARHTRPVARRAVLGVVLLASSLTTWVTVEYTALEADHALMRLQWAQPLLITAGPDAVPQVVLLTQLRALLVFMRLPLDTRLSAEQQNMMAQVAQRYGYAPVLIRQSIALHRNGRSHDAQAVLDRLCKTQPKKFCDSARRQVAAEIGTSGP
jgi:O-antigen ligase